jgi:hypothetical protein
MVPQRIMSSCHVSKPPLVRRVGDHGGRNCGASQVSNWRKQCASSGSISSQLVSLDTVGDVCVVAGGTMASKGPANQLVVGGRRVSLCGQKSRFCEFCRRNLESCLKDFTPHHNRTIGQTVDQGNLSVMAKDGHQAGTSYLVRSPVTLLIH